MDKKELRTELDKSTSQLRTEQDRSTAQLSAKIDALTAASVAERENVAALRGSSDVLIQLELQRLGAAPDPAAK
ncbi:MAG: hypothetical protein J3K34DRAFT_468736 [Monoraphidium minutum]|nr:MAG: hypothetical protein J3K34DRAFT_468736 [Monoraphidium minutum]